MKSVPVSDTFTVWYFTLASLITSDRGSADTSNCALVEETVKVWSDAEYIPLASWCAVIVTVPPRNIRISPSEDMVVRSVLPEVYVTGAPLIFS